MGIKKVLKESVFGGLNPKKWLGFGVLKQQTSISRSLLSSTFKSRKEGDGYRPESFEDCMRHYGVSEEDLKAKMKNALYTTYFCLGLSLITLSYMFYQFAKTSFTGGLMCLILTILLWSMAFREHFNLYQMRKRRLGCSFKEWFYSLIKK